jgi:formate hydrogenlyase subunit 6/NADH:ubiquinone oxidoreductase subunit I
MDEWVVPNVDLGLCTLCGECVSRCPEHAVEMTAEGPNFSAPESCTYCGVCEDLCPEGAIARTYVIVWDTRPSDPPSSPREE